MNRACICALVAICIIPLNAPIAHAKNKQEILEHRQELVYARRQAIPRLRPCVFIGEGMGLVGEGASYFLIQRWVELQLRVGVLPPLNNRNLTRITPGLEINFYTIKFSIPVRPYFGILYYTTLKGLFNITSPNNIFVIDIHYGLSFKLKIFKPRIFDMRIGLTLPFRIIGFTVVYGIGMRI